MFAGVRGTTRLQSRRRLECARPAGTLTPRVATTGVAAYCASMLTPARRGTGQDVTRSRPRAAQKNTDNIDRQIFRRNGAAPSALR